MNTCKPAKTPGTFPAPVRTGDTITWATPGGTEFREKVLPSGTCYREDTNPMIIAVLEALMGKKQKVRLHYGDPVTGEDSLEECDVLGRIGRSTGIVKVPLLIETGEDGGGPISLSRLLRISVQGHVLYEHPSYHLPAILLKEETLKGYSHKAVVKNETHARFKSAKEADKWMKFIQG